MTRYTQLRHNGYYQDGLTDTERQTIADKVDNADTRTETPKQSTTSNDLNKPAAKTTTAKAKRTKDTKK